MRSGVSATILQFTGRPARPEAPTPPPVFTMDWVEHHQPLIDAALDPLQADDAEFNRRCRLMADADGKALLAQLCGQIESLGAHVSDVATALAMTAMRIRTTVTLEA